MLIFCFGISAWLARISEIHQLQRYLGCRVSEAVNLKTDDFEHNLDGSITVIIYWKGGLVRRVSTSHEETIKLLIERTTGRKSGAQLFQFKTKNNNDKNKVAAAKLVKETIRAAAVRSGVDRDGKKYTSHSGRKAFAQSTVNTYAAMTTRELKKIVAKVIREDTGLKRKYKKTVENVRAKINDNSKNKNRDLNHKELALWLTSVKLGHGQA